MRRSTVLCLTPQLVFPGLRVRPKPYPRLQHLKLSYMQLQELQKTERKNKGFTILSIGRFHHLHRQARAPLEPDPRADPNAPETARVVQENVGGADRYDRPLRQGVRVQPVLVLQLNQGRPGTTSIKSFHCN
jgi:hypothetical protein